jgi:hypothetical protein
VHCYVKLNTVLYFVLYPLIDLVLGLISTYCGFASATWIRLHYYQSSLFSASFIFHSMAFLSSNTHGFGFIYVSRFAISHLNCIISVYHIVILIKIINTKFHYLWIYWISTLDNESRRTFERSVQLTRIRLGYRRIHHGLFSDMETI